MKSADPTTASQGERFIVRGDPEGHHWAARSAASGPEWSRRSRDYLVRIQAEVPERAREWKLFDDLDHTGAAYTPNYPTPQAVTARIFARSKPRRPTCSTPRS